MKSICSTFIGLCFPHTIEFETRGTEEFCHFLLYEMYQGRYSVKVIAKKEMVLTALNDYRSVYSEDMQHQKQPLMICVTGPMEQVRLDFDYIGSAVSEKFHIEPVNLSVIPCNPYIAENLKDLAHPQIAPQQFTGNGYALFDYVVVLDENHTGPVSHLEHARKRKNDEMWDENDENVKNDGNPQVKINLPRENKIIGNPAAETKDEDPEDFMNSLLSESRIGQI